MAFFNYLSLKKSWPISSTSRIFGPKSWATTNKPCCIEFIMSHLSKLLIIYLHRCAPIELYRSYSSCWVRQHTSDSRSGFARLPLAVFRWTKNSQYCLSGSLPDQSSPVVQIFSRSQLLSRYQHSWDRAGYRQSPPGTCDLGEAFEVFSEDHWLLSVTQDQYWGRYLKVYYLLLKGSERAKMRSFWMLGSVRAATCNLAVSWTFTNHSPNSLVPQSW